MYSENYKTSIKETKEDRNRERYCVHGLEDDVVKKSVDPLTKLMCKLHKIYIKNQARLFFCRDKIILKFVWKGKVTRIAKTMLNTKNTFQRVTLPEFNTSYIVIVT